MTQSKSKHWIEVCLPLVAMHAKAISYGEPSEDVATGVLVLVWPFVLVMEVAYLPLRVLRAPLRVLGRRARLRG